jgi:acetyl esterase/lipase
VRPHAVLVALLAFGCASPSSLTVQLVSDLTPPRDVDAVSIAVTGESGPERTFDVPLTAGASLGRPRRVLELGDLAPGSYGVVITLERGGAAVVARTLRVQVRGPTIRTVELTRDCRDVTCAADETCASGRCAPVECSDETPEACGTPICESDAECPPSTVECAPARCLPSGACAAIPDDDGCSAGAPVCDSTLGCLGAELGSALVLTGEARPGARSVAISATTADATEVFLGISPVALDDPGLADVMALGTCGGRGAGLECVAGGLEPATTYYAYAIAVRASASGDQVSNVFEQAVTTREETVVLDVTSAGLPGRAVVWAPDAAYQDDTGTRFPVIIFLHGGGEMGSTDPESILTGDGLFRDLLLDRELSATFPFIVLGPHCSQAMQECNGWPAAVTLPIDTLEAAAATFSIDPDRVYVTGLSFGGEGSFRMAALYPDRIAAAVPIASTTWVPTPEICGAVGTPIWAFHGAYDTFWAPSNSESFMTALEACAGTAAPRQLSLLDCRSPPSDHCGWNEVYSDTAGASFGTYTSIYAWMLAQELP